MTGRGDGLVRKSGGRSACPAFAGKNRYAPDRSGPVLPDGLQLRAVFPASLPNGHDTAGRAARCLNAPDLLIRQPAADEDERGRLVVEAKRPQGRHRLAAAEDAVRALARVADCRLPLCITSFRSDCLQYMTVREGGVDKHRRQLHQFFACVAVPASGASLPASFAARPLSGAPPSAPAGAGSGAVCPAAGAVCTTSAAGADPPRRRKGRLHGSSPINDRGAPLTV